MEGRRKAIILAGGKGTRLSPYTVVFPKPMLPVGNIPILEIIIRQLAYYGFKDIVVSVGYLSELIQAYFQNFGKLPSDIKLSFVKEKKPLGTAGPIGLIPDLRETFLVMNGDVLTTLDYSKLFAFHKEKKATLTIGIHRKDIKMELGIVELDDDQRVINYIEKPTYTYFDSMGIYVYEPRVLKYIEPNVYLDFPTLVLRLIENGERVYGYLHDKPHFWLDMGRFGDYQKASEEFEKRKEEFLPK